MPRPSTGQYLGRNGDLPDAGVAGSGIDAVSLDWDEIRTRRQPFEERAESAAAFLADSVRMNSGSL